MELLQLYLKPILKWWWLIILFAAIGAAASYATSPTPVATYQATATLIVGQSIINSDNPNTYILELSDTLADTYADMAQRQPVLEKVVESLDLPYSWEALKGRAGVRLIRGTQLIEVTAIGTSEEDARIIADEFARQLILLSPTDVQNQEFSEEQLFIQERLKTLQAKIEVSQERVNELEEVIANTLSAQQEQDLLSEKATLEGSISSWERQYSDLLPSLDSEKPVNNLAIVEPAQARTSFTRSRTEFNTMIGGAVGLMLAIGLIFVIEYFDDTIRSPNELMKLFGLRTLGLTTYSKTKNQNENLLLFQSPFSDVTEAYRIMRNNIQFLSPDQKIGSIMVTCADHEKSRSVTTANIGIILAQAGIRTILVDADLRQPKQHALFQVPNPSGLTELLRSADLKISHQLQRTSVENLLLLPSGTLTHSPTELLYSPRMDHLISALCKVADAVIFDSPPVIPIADAAALSCKVDNVLLVFEEGQTRRGDAEQALSILGEARANVLGAILNGSAKKRKRSNYKSDYPLSLDGVTKPSFDNDIRHSENQSLNTAIVPMTGYLTNLNGSRRLNGKHKNEGLADLDTIQQSANGKNGF